MRYDFDTPLRRLGTGCMKWDEHGGSPEAVGFESGKPYIPLWVADMDFRTAPAIIEALKRRVEHGAFGYTLVPDSYYDAVISWFRRRHQWTIERDWIQYTSGVVPALSVIVKALTHPGDSVIVQTPVYNCFFSSIRNNGCEVVANPLRQVEHETPQNSQEEWDVSQSLHYEMDFDDLEAKARSPRAKLLILCNPHNPVGRTWTEAELRRVYMICKDNGVTVVSDEIHNELTYRGLRYAPYGDVCRMDNAIICTSPSKSFNTAGLQIANIICADPSWRQRIDRAINQNEVCDVNPFGVAALQAAYDESEDWLDQLCEYIYQNYEALCHFLRTQLPQLRVTPLEGTYLVWVDIRKLGISSDEMGEKLLREENVEVNVGTMYDPEGGKDFIRLNIACPRAQLMEGLERIKCFCERHF